MDPRLAGLMQIVTRAPWWVWLILAVLLVLGLRRRRTRIMSLARFAALPAVFLVWGLISLALAASIQPEVAVAWALTAVLGAGAGWLVTPSGIRGDRQRRRIEVPGSTWPLAASLTVFVLKYAVAIALAIKPDARTSIAIVDMAVSGASAGFFAASWVRGLMLYRRGPHTPLEDDVVAA
jgi:hypothetical protein